jgi:hypothetical protein
MWQTLLLNDKLNGQKIILEPLISKFGKPSKIKFEIMSVYKGLKWQDTAISEMYYTGG